MQYYARLSGKDASKSTIENLVRNCIDFYENFTLLAKTQSKKDGVEVSVMESRPTDDFCLIAAMALLQPNKTSGEVSDKSFIRAAGILERLLVDSPHNYEAILSLIRIYILLGAGSLALKAFSKLSIKHVQYETVGHILFTRFATIHPFSAPPYEGAEYKDFDPQAAFVQGLDFYRSANLTVSRSLMNGLREGSYVNLEETIELRNRLSDSICRRILALETRRVQRLRKGEHLNYHEEAGKSSSTHCKYEANDS
jgi:N-terminal acetyltransferase B complex non-catalytic subunit